MGMAASQARLLTLTARLADNELRSQTINNAKMRLATQSSQASENYVNALNNATLKFANYDEAGESQIQALSFNALTAYSSYNTQYGLVNSSGQILVSEEEALMFNKANGNVNAYLQMHGLEYTTTYFNELGAMKNDAYPEPFNLIASDELKTYYENYNSYNNSYELETYEKSYASYVSATNNLNKGSKAFYEAFLGHGSSPALVNNSGNFEFDLSSVANIQGLVNTYKNAFKSSSNNYNLDTLLANGFISQNDYKFIQKQYIDSVKYVQGHSLPDGSTVSGLKIVDPIDLEYVATETEKKFIVDGSIQVTVDDNMKVIGFADVPDDGSAARSFNNVTTDGSLSFKEFMNQLSLNDNDGDSENPRQFFTEYEVTGDGSEANPYSAGSYVVIPDLAEAKDAINEMVGVIIDTLKNNTNYENFAKWLLNQNTATLLTGYGIDINKPTIVNSMTLNELLTQYSDAKNEYFGSIFPDDPAVMAIVEQDLSDGYTFKNAQGKDVQVTPENLSDIDFCLQYMKNKNLSPAASFETVIKKHLIDLMVDINGEPKYAWVDSNDTGNTGNADAKAQWYTNLFKRMQQGYKALENGLAASSEWLEFALENGIVTMEQVDKSFNWKGLDYKTCTRITEETDDAAVTKAEAEYNRAMNDIKAKDNIYDIQLKNIDTEHTSLQTEYDVIKGVIDKNIARTFKFNQSA